MSAEKGIPVRRKERSDPLEKPFRPYAPRPSSFFRVFVLSCFRDSRLSRRPPNCDTAYMNAVELQGVTKRFGHHVAVDRLDLAVPEGTVYGFIGPNGSGKTTTLRMILRILYPESGRITVLGRDQLQRGRRPRGLPAGGAGPVQADAGPRPPDLLRAAQGLPRLPRGGRPVAGALRPCGLGQPEGRGALQGHGPEGAVHRRGRGPAQAARSSTSPSPASTRSTWRCSRTPCSRCTASGTTVIFSTHDMDIAERMCDTIFMICRGKKVLDGTLEAIQAQYGQDTIRVRLGEGNGSLRQPARRRSASTTTAATPNSASSRAPTRRRSCRNSCGARGSSTSRWPARRCTTSSSASPARSRSQQEAARA